MGVATGALGMFTGAIEVATGTLGVASAAALGSCLSISCWSPTGCLLPSLLASVCVKVDDIE